MIGILIAHLGAFGSGELKTQAIPHPPRLPSKSFNAAVPLNFSPSSIRVDSWQPGLCNDSPKAPTLAVLMRHILKLMY